MRKKKTYKRKKYGSGIKVARPYINKRNRLMLGEGIKVARPYINKRNRLMVGEGKRKTGKKKQLKNKQVVFLHQ